MSDDIDQLETFAAENLDIPAPDPVTPIYVPGGGISIRDTARQIYERAASQETLYHYNRQVVTLVPSINGVGQEIMVLKPAAARSEFEKYGSIVRRGKGTDQKTTLSEQDAKAVLDCDIAGELLPTLKAVLDTPIPILQAGKFEVLQPGYNSASHFFVTGGSIEEPATLNEAVQLVETMLADFEFQTDSDISRAIAFLLTPAMKLGGFITGFTPFEIIEANESQTGKGFLANLRAVLYGQQPLLLPQQKGGVGSSDERLGSLLLKGKPFIILDNYRGELNSQSLESLLTSTGPIAVRTPYSAERYVDGAIYFIVATSNGMTITEDLANRSSFIRLEKEADREFSEIGGKSIDEVVKMLQPKFMGAITKIIRHWFSEGMPRTSEKRHSFRQWAQSLDWIVQNVFNQPPLLDGNEGAQKRAQNPVLGFVREVCILAEKESLCGQPQTAKELSELCERGGLKIPGVEEKLEIDTEKKRFQRIGQLMGMSFGETNELEVEPYRILRTRGKNLSGGGNSYPTLEYAFSRIDAGVAEPEGAELAEQADPGLPADKPHTSGEATK